MKEFKTITEIEILREVQGVLLSKMIEALKDMLDVDARNLCNYDYFKFQAARYEELNKRILELEEDEE